MSLVELIQQNRVGKIASLFETVEPVDIAGAAADLDDEELSRFEEMLDDPSLAKVIEVSEDRDRMRMVDHLGNHRLLFVFRFMEKDDIVDILGDMTIGRRKALVDLMKSEDRRTITELLRYPEESAGGIMTTRYIALRSTMTATDALEKIRQIGPKTEQIETIYIVDENRRLIGAVDLRDILLAEADEPMAAFMHEHVISIAPEEDQEEAARLVTKYDLNAIPVVSSGRILGIITVDDIIDVIVEEHEEDMMQLAGANVEEDLDTPLAASIKMRLPWLMVNLLTAFLASSVVNLFEDTIAQVVALSAIMTIISGMGGNAGSQTMSIIIRALSKDGVDREEARAQLVKEIFGGAMNGLIIGAITALVVIVVYRNGFLGVIVVLAMVGNMVIGGVAGLLIPVLLKKLGKDPALASSIFLTTVTDTLGFFLLLGLAQAFLPLIR
ncbi:MAG: magnesium transporter [Peptoniphilaceae bacterium]|nr:magnesium transporter [Peptoniphilaceae bacterium]